MRYVYVNGMNAYLTAADYARNEGIPAAKADRFKVPSPVPSKLTAAE